MANTRWDVLDSSWKKLKKVYPEVFSAKKDSNIPRVHCIIPLCIGYNQRSLVPFDILDAWVRAVRKNNFNFTIYKDPRQGDFVEQLASEGENRKLPPLKQWEMEFEAWKSLNPESPLAQLKTGELEDIQIWRNTSTWKEAYESVLAIKKADTQKHFEEALEKDTISFCQKYEQRNIDKIPAQDLEKIIQQLKGLSHEHNLKTCADYLSWMNKIDKFSNINLLFYSHSLSKSMYIIRQICHNKNYNPDSLIHIQPECQKVILEDINDQSASSNALIQKDIDKDRVMKDIVKALLLTSEELPEGNNLKQKAGELFFYAVLASHGIGEKANLQQTEDQNRSITNDKGSDKQPEVVKKTSPIPFTKGTVSTLGTFGHSKQPKEESKENQSLVQGFKRG